MKQILTFLMITIGIVAQAQLAGTVDTTFVANSEGVANYHAARGVEVIGNSVYYAYATSPGVPAIKKYDLDGNEDESWSANQMATWGAQFATIKMEPERSSNGDYTGKLFICGRNSFNSMVNQGVRFLNKINANGTRDLNFVCPITSWISICSAMYHDWENGKLYYAYRSGSSLTQILICCDANTGQTLQTLTIPGSNDGVRCITKVPNTNDIVVGGNLNFTFNGNQYVGMFKLTDQFTIAPLEGITNLPCSFSVADILFVSDVDCDGNATGGTTVYVAGGGNTMSGVDGLRGIARFNLTNDTWIIDGNYNAGCSGSIGDIVYYNCHLIATGNFASSMPTGPYAPTWTPKVTAFTADGYLSEEFKLINTGYGLGGVALAGFENSFGQGSGTCLAVNPAEDGNDRWEIFVGGTFMNIIQGPSNPRSVLKSANFMAKLYGFDSAIDTRFTYCLDEGVNGSYSIHTFEASETSGCEKWELYQSNDPSGNWTLVRTDFNHAFSDTTLVGDMWYKLVRIVSECGNVCSSNYIWYRTVQDCLGENSGVELRAVVVDSADEQVLRYSEQQAVSLTIQPNPTVGLVTVVDSDNSEFRNVAVYNSIGAVVATSTANNKTYQLDLTDLPAGVYMIVVTTDSGVLAQQVIKE
jgi:hypothetical protein